MKISIIIPVYNHLQLTIRCLDNIKKFSYYFKDTEVIIVDDGSFDGSPDHFMHFARENPWLIYHRNTSNQKFASSCNTGANMARGEFLIFLNNDTVVTENWDKHLLDTLEQDPNTWMVGAKLLYPNGTIQHAGVYLPDLTGQSFGHVYRTFPSYFPPANFEKELQCITAACMIMRRVDFQQLGGFDTGYLNGLEDVDLCLKIISLGKKIRYQPECEVMHFESQSEGRLDHSRQNAERLTGKWKGQIRPDYNEMITRDISHCISHNLMTRICNFDSGDDRKTLLEINKQLKINAKGNIEWILPLGQDPVQIPLEPDKIEDELFFILECHSTEKTYARLQYRTKSGYEDPGHLILKQNIHPGYNHIMFNIGTGFLENKIELVFTGKKSTVGFLSFSIYSYKKNLPARVPSLTMIHHPENYPGQIEELSRELVNSGFEIEIDIKRLPAKPSAEILNSAIGSCQSEYILVLDKDLTSTAKFIINAIEIMELQPKTGFVYSDIDLNNLETISFFEQEFFSGNLLESAKTDIPGIFRKSCWQSVQGYDGSVSYLRNLDLFLGINASGNWSGYKMIYPGFSYPDKILGNAPDFSKEKEHISAKYLKYILKVCGKIMTRAQNIEKTGKN